MELTLKQKKTLEDLKKIKIEEPSAIIQFCAEKLTQPRRFSLGLVPNQKGKKRRRHGKSHYLGIIKYLQMNKNLNPSYLATTDGIY